MYEEMTFDSIMEGMLERLPEDIDRREGSIAYDSTAAVAFKLAETYFMLGNYLDLVFADTSAGEFLDRFAAVFNLARKPAMKAVRYGNFDKEIPAGRRFSTNGNDSLIFVTGDLVKNESGTFTYLMECEIPGKIGNDYVGELIPVEYISGLGAAEIGAVVTAGNDEESDESLRERFFAKVQRPSTSGNVNDYYNWAMSCNGVGAAKIFPLADGPGTVKVVITSADLVAADEGLIGKVASYIEEVRPIGATVSVVSARERTVNVSARVKLTGATTLGMAQDAFSKAVNTHLQNSAFDAEYISLARIGNILMGISGIEDYTDLKLNGENKNITLADEEIAVCGAVRLEVM